MGIKDGKVIMSWANYNWEEADWIGLYESDSAGQNQYLKYYWIDYTGSPMQTKIEPKPGMQVRVYRRTGMFSYKEFGRTAPFPELGTYSDEPGYPRSCTDSEWENIYHYFPKLQRERECRNHRCSDRTI